MQIFRPFPSHKDTARFLDDKRLNKQIVECYQIGMVCLSLKGIVNYGTGWKNHPITKAIYNDGNSYLLDLYNYIIDLDNEWYMRGFNRKRDFYNKLVEMFDLIKFHKREFSRDPLPLIYVSNGVVIKDTEEIFDLYKQLLMTKWINSKTPPRRERKLIL